MVNKYKKSESSGYNWAASHELSKCDSIHKPCVRSNESPAWRGKVGMKSHFRQRSYWQLIAVGRQEPVFFMSFALGKSITLLWKATHPKIYGQHKLDLMMGKGVGKDTKLGGLGKGEI